MKIASAVSACILTGCASIPTAHEVRAPITSGLIGCPAAEIETGAHDKLTWTATCRGKIFYCSVGASDSCTAAVKAPGG